MLKLTLKLTYVNICYVLYGKYDNNGIIVEQDYQITNQNYIRYHDRYIEIYAVNVYIDFFGRVLMSIISFICLAKIGL
ncbi:unnamed protein product [Rhizophagus irregularis]|nr:unnamed protein product [Rhizophagus irregularis]CAB5376173.1 unnamed protein product [Rhizophagus irregularis]